LLKKKTTRFDVAGLVDQTVAATRLAALISIQSFLREPKGPRQGAAALSNGDAALRTSHGGA